MRTYITYKNKGNLITEEFNYDILPFIGSPIIVNGKFHLVDNVCFDYDKREITILTKY